MPDEPLDDLQHEIDAAVDLVAKLTRDVDSLQRRVDRLSALQPGAAAEEAQLRALEPVLDFDRVARHVGAACAAGHRSDDPVPHLVISDVFPADVYTAIVEAIPEAVFFEAVTDGGYELGVPPRLAPFRALLTWEFVQAVVKRAFSAALLARLHEPVATFGRTRFPDLPPFDDWNVEVTISRGRVFRRCPGYAGASSEDRPWDLLTAIVSVGGSPDDGLYGSVLGSRPFPFRQNGALAFVGPASAHEYGSIPHGAQQALRYTYEFGVGPTREGRRVLNALMKAR